MGFWGAVIRSEIEFHLKFIGKIVLSSSFIFLFATGLLVAFSELFDILGNGLSFNVGINVKATFSNVNLLNDT
jgi:hypothetical protein